MISIITVVYNGEETIADTLNSVCNQTLLPTEYLIIDGLSTDKTLDIIKEYASHYSFIKFISEKDSGIYDAMNKGISLAKGQLIGIINSDDWYEKDALANMWNTYKVNGSGIYYGIQRNILDNKEFYLERVSHEFISKKMIPHPSTFVSADIYKKHGAFDLNLKFSSDLEFMIRSFTLGTPFYKLDNIIANFRIGGVSSTPKAGIESIVVREKYGLISKKQYRFALLKLNLKSILNF